MNGDHSILDSSAMIYDRALAYFEDECKKAKEERKIHARHTTGLRAKSEKNKGFEGDKRVDQLRDLLENGFYDAQSKRIIRSKEQRLIHETYIRTCLPKIYQSEWEDNQERIMLQFELEKLQQEALVVMPRRSGKTWSMAMFCAAMLIVCSGTLHYFSLSLFLGVISLTHPSPSPFPCRYRNLHLCHRSAYRQQAAQAH